MYMVLKGNGSMFAFQLSYGEQVGCYHQLIKYFDKTFSSLFTPVVPNYPVVAVLDVIQEPEARLSVGETNVSKVGIERL